MPSHVSSPRPRTNLAAIATRLAAQRSLWEPLVAFDPVSRYYLRATVHGGRAFGTATQKAVRQVEKAAAKRTSARAFAKITEVADDGSMHIVEAPPTLTHVDAELEARLSELVDEYRVGGRCRGLGDVPGFGSTLDGSRCAVGCCEQPTRPSRPAAATS